MRTGCRLLLGWAWAVSAAWGQGPAPAAAPAPEAPMNLADNPGFEERVTDAPHLPFNWETFGSSDTVMATLTDAVKRSGDRAGRIKAKGRKGAYAGFVQAKTINPKARYFFRAHFLNDASEPLNGGVEAVVSIEWHDADGLEILRSESRPLNPGASRTSWKELEIAARPPPRAARAKFVVVLREPKQPGEGAVLVDDVEIRAR